MAPGHADRLGVPWCWSALARQCQRVAGGTPLIDLVVIEGAGPELGPREPTLARVSSVHMRAMRSSRGPDAKDGWARLVWAAIIGLLVAVAVFGTLLAARRCPLPCPPPAPEAFPPSACALALLGPCPLDALDLLAPLAAGAIAALWIARWVRMH